MANWFQMICGELGLEQSLSFESESVTGGLFVRYKVSLTVIQAQCFIVLIFFWLLYNM